MLKIILKNDDKIKLNHLEKFKVSEITSCYFMDLEIDNLNKHELKEIQNLEEKNVCKEFEEWFEQIFLADLEIINYDLADFVRSKMEMYSDCDRISSIIFRKKDAKKVFTDFLEDYTEQYEQLQINNIRNKFFIIKEKITELI